MQRQTEQKELCFSHMGVFKRMFSTRNTFSGEHDVAVRVHLTALHYSQPPKTERTCQLLKEMKTFLLDHLGHFA